MSALPKSEYSVESLSVSKKNSQLNSQKNYRQPKLSQTKPQKISTQSQQELKKTHNFSKKSNFISSILKIENKINLRLNKLAKLQPAFIGLSTVLVASSTFVYIATVSIPQKWSQEYEQLQKLQRQERELIAANEVIKNSITKQAKLKETQDKNQLNYLKPNDIVFLKATDVQPSSSKNQSKIQFSPSSPLGY